MGDVASLQCTVFKGDLPINITWLHNNKPIGYNEGIIISYPSKKVSTLTIDDVQEDHSGNFSCLAQNIAGLMSYSTELHVNGIISIFYALSLDIYCYFHSVLFEFLFIAVSVMIFIRTSTPFSPIIH